VYGPIFSNGPNDSVLVMIGSLRNSKNRLLAACEAGAVADIYREVLGNPFRPVVCDPAWPQWRGGAVVVLAQELYDSRAFSKAPLWADALEDAGCTDPAILDHLRGPGPHARGCCAVDLILGVE
jgi:hypothetical protein